MAEASSTLTINGQAVEVSLSPYGESEADFGIDMQYYWEQPSIGTYTAIGTHYGLAFTCQITVFE